MKQFNAFKFTDFRLLDSSLRLGYSFDDALEFYETLRWQQPIKQQNLNSQSVNAALTLTHLILGVSYYKAYLPAKLSLPYQLAPAQTDFLNRLYQNGLGEFLYKNQLKFDDIAQFKPSADDSEYPTQQRKPKTDRKILLPMSGGKDSLLTAHALKQSGHSFTPLYVTTDGNYPSVIDEFGSPIVVERRIDHQLITENQQGAYNGHVPFSAILASILVSTAVIYGFNDIVLSQESSADEATARYDGREINHQYSKSSAFEVAMQSYIHQFIDQDLRYFSLLRSLSELEIHKMFVKSGLWQRLSGKWSSCNLANYKQGNDTSQLSWCGECSKCANAFLLFAPFVPKSDLLAMFEHKNLLAESQLRPIFEQLLGMSEAKPFECVAEINELRQALLSLRQNPEWPEANSFPDLSSDSVANKHRNPTSQIPDEYRDCLKNIKL